jgi:hypothetical protein
VASDGRIVAGSLAVDFAAALAAGLSGVFKEGALCAATNDEDKAKTSIQTEFVELRMVSFQGKSE